MPYNNHLEERINQFLIQKKIPFETIKMMGGLCFMVNDKMLCGIINDDFMARVGQENYEELLKKSGARPMDFTKKNLAGYLFVSGETVDSDQGLDFWMQQCLAFNPKAKASKRK